MRQTLFYAFLGICIGSFINLVISSVFYYKKTKNEEISDEKLSKLKTGMMITGILLFVISFVYIKFKQSTIPVIFLFIGLSLLIHGLTVSKTNLLTHVILWSIFFFLFLVYSSIISIKQ